VRDLRGMKIGEPAPSSNILAYALQTGGMTFKDVQPIVLGFPEQFAALQSGALDAMNTVEPFMTRAVQAGVGVKILGYDKVSPNMTVASILYGGPFMKNEPDVARTFMVAYLQAVRYYNDALQNGHLAGRNADDVITILGKYLPLKDPAVYRAITPNGVDPNGHVNVASLQRDLRFYRSEGLIEGDLVADQIVDHRYVDAALKILGPYRPAR
jgi:NitT/TauT family transport system substrate-binding protein